MIYDFDPFWHNYSIKTTSLGNNNLFLITMIKINNGTKNLASYYSHHQSCVRCCHYFFSNLVPYWTPARWYSLLRDRHQNICSYLCDVAIPLFSLLAVTIITSEFKFAKAVEHFKFLQLVPGLALFNLL